MRRTALLVLVALLAACGGDDAPEQPAAPKDGIRELDNILALRSDFEAEKGKTRLLVLFSPT